MTNTTLKRPFNRSFRLRLTHEQQGEGCYCKKFHRSCNLDLARYLDRLDNLPILGGLAIRGVFGDSSVNERLCCCLSIEVASSNRFLSLIVNKRTKAAMNFKHPISRRSAVQWAVTSAALSAVPFALKTITAEESRVSSPILKTLKIGMVKVKGSLEDKFRAVKAAGFDGIELNAPKIDVEETRAAIAKTGLPVDGTVCSTHWEVRHSSPDSKVRAQALQDLKDGIEQTSAIGGNTILLVVGHGKDGPESEIIPRSIDNISKALPLAAKHGIYIAIENVWNHFLYDHDGPMDQTADRFVQYVDAFNSPWVGMQFDIGNHWQYGDPAAWIRTLGKRVVKLDTKGYSRATKKFTAITAGDIDWPSVHQSLKEIGFHGWCAAEVSGGDEEALRIVANEMQQTLG